MLPLILGLVGGGLLVSAFTEDKKYAKGGSVSKKQGYDDKKDESLSMQHGKIAKKDFVGTHKQKEHSRRDDAEFEERMAKGGSSKTKKETMTKKATVAKKNPQTNKFKQVMAHAKATRKQGEAWTAAVSRAWKEMGK